MCCVVSVCTRLLGVVVSSRAMGVPDFFRDARSFPSRPQAHVLTSPLASPRPSPPLGALLAARRRRAEGALALETALTSPLESPRPSPPLPAFRCSFGSAPPPRPGCPRPGDGAGARRQERRRQGGSRRGGPRAGPPGCPGACRGGAFFFFSKGDELSCDGQVLAGGRGSLCMRAFHV